MSRVSHISAQLRRVLVLTYVFVVAPSAGLLSVGILVLVLGRAPRDTVFGVLILSLVTTMALGTIAALIYVLRSASLARLQTDFVNRVSHELRTPLCSIRMFAETLQLGRVHDPAGTRQCLEVIVAESLRLSSMIDRLLNWGRMEAGRRVYERQPRQPQEIVTAAVTAFARQTTAQPVRVTTEIEPDLPDVMVDLDAMSEAVLNLLQNAYLYSAPGQPITVRVARRRKHVLLTVADQGIGIPKSELRRIFEKFYRGAQPHAMSVPGSGLGLAIVDHIVRGHDGRVVVESEPGRGTTFSILLTPAQREHDGRETAHH
jgi:two-component system phosphate regulon sensor histidine kinase PhoR